MAEFNLESVSVFQSSAMFNMVGVVKCKAGENVIMAEKLTRMLDKDSIRVKGKGPGRIANIIIEKQYSEEVDKEKVKELQKKIEELDKINKKKVDDLGSAKKLKEQKLAALNSFSTEYPKWYSIGKIDLQKVKDLDALFKEQIAEISKEIRKLGYEINDLQNQMAELQNKISDMGYSSRREVNSYYDVTIVIDAKEAKEFTIELNFMVSGAYWQPFYDVIILEEDVEINLMANVYNQTGVDWNDVTLEISTASNEPVKLEKPDPYNIDDYTPMYDRRKGKPKKALPMGGARMDFVAQAMAPAPPMEDKEFDLKEEFYEEEPEPQPELETVTSEVSSSFGVQKYTLNTKYTIVSDKNPKPLPLFKEKLPSILQYFWTTTASSRVLCNNKIRNKSHLILPGNAKVYVSDEFIGETYLDLIAPNEEFKLGERVTYDVKVEKKLKSKKKEKEGALKGKRSVTYSYEIKIENLNKVTEELILYDRIPHSVSERIKVKLGEFSDEPASNVMNVLKYVIDMSTLKEKKSITYDYEVVYEKGVNISPPLP